VVAKSVGALGGLFGLGRRRLGKGGRREEREQGRPVALHAHLAALVHQAAGEVVRAPLLVARVADALYLERLGKGVSCGVRCKGRGCLLISFPLLYIRRSCVL